jgi:hypothetical protein
MPLDRIDDLAMLAVALHVHGITGGSTAPG